MAQISFDRNNYFCQESKELCFVCINVTNDIDLNRKVNVSVTFKDGTAKGKTTVYRIVLHMKTCMLLWNPTEGKDYTGKQVDTTFLNETNSLCITFTIFDDMIDELGETFLVELRTSAKSTGLSSCEQEMGLTVTSNLVFTDVATVTIVDNGKVSLDTYPTTCFITIVLCSLY